jgi:hypothetical protein
MPIGGMPIGLNKTTKPTSQARVGRTSNMVAAIEVTSRNDLGVAEHIAGTPQREQR